jgi:hypothetical protein
MSGDNYSSIFTRPPKLPPAVSLMLGFVCIPLGAVIQDTVGGVLVGGGVGALATAAWDFGRIRFVAWRRGRAKRGVESREDRGNRAAAFSTHWPKNAFKSAE